MTFVSVVEFLHESRAEHAFAFAVDKDYFLTLVFQVCIHHLAEFVDLKIQDIGSRQAGRGVDKLRYMKVYFNYLSPFVGTLFLYRLAGGTINGILGFDPFFNT